MRNLLKVVALGFALCGLECNAQTVSGQIDGYDYVDLGLKSGTKWATYNVGATKPEEYGDYYSWGESTPKKSYCWEDYKWTTDDGDTFTKYGDSKRILDAKDDVATVNWGSAWRMPTNDEFEELISGCTWEWVKDFDGKGKNGLLGTSKANDNKIFLSAVGYYDCQGLAYVGQCAYYWSSTRSIKYPYSAESFLFFNKKYEFGECHRGRGQCVRAVANKVTDPEEFVVTFYTKDSVLIESQKVEKGKAATAVDAPKVDGYEFVGWSDSSFTNVAKDLNVYAQYKEITKDILSVSGQIDSYDYVDLGLPSGTLWATYNVGATKPEEYGDYFAWGETEPKAYYDWTNYKLCTLSPEGYLRTFTKYCTDNDYGTIDYRYSLEKVDDAATVNWGNNWRMPSQIELRELYEGCNWERVTDLNGSSIDGQLGTSKKNGKAIFLPAAGVISLDGTPYGDGGIGSYWSADLRGIATFNAYRLYFINKSFVLDDYNSRQLGFSVRAVATAKSTGCATISNLALQVYAGNGTISIVNAQPNTNIQVFDINGMEVKSVVTDGNGNAEITASKGVYVVTVGNQSTKVIVK